MRTLTLPSRALCALVATAVVLVAAPACAQAPPASPHPTEGPVGASAITSWTLALDTADRGLARGWARGGFAGRAVSVPSVVDPLHFKGRAGARNYEGSVAWYRTTFDAPHAGTYALSFRSANWRANVYVDGRELASHTGSYLPFDARAALGEGVHTLVVRVDWRNPRAQSRAGFHRTWFNWGGLNGAVSMREIGASELTEPTVAVRLSPDAPDAESARVVLRVRVRNNGPARVLAPRATLAREGVLSAVAFAPRMLAAGETARMSATLTIVHPALWGPGHPNLYDLQISEGTESTFAARIGLRELSRRGGALYLNGSPLHLHGASLQEDARGHGDALTDADEDELVSELRAIGANVVRSQHPLDAALLERLDAAGILVWQGVGPVEGAAQWYARTPALRRSAEAQVRSAVGALSLHPSIIAWNLLNEVAANGQAREEVRYVRALGAWLHRVDPQRMVAVDVWGDHPPRVSGAIYAGVDAVSETDYTGWYDDPGATPAVQRAHMRARLRAMERTFNGKVLLISEFGAESNALNPPGAPGSYAFQSRLLERHISVYGRDRRLTGMIVWNLRDYPLAPAFRGGTIERKLPRVRLVEGMLAKGLFTYAGRPKPAAAAVARMFRALAAS
jgi:Glycosyl hydrolases family 2, TIM barrel domain/Glycosyl hydrolases family 2